MRFQPGDSVGAYRVTGTLGEGSSGVVYKVFNTVTGRLEAMKILADNISHDLDHVQRFLREIQLHAQLEHPNIAQVRTAFCEGQTLALIMEVVDGEPLNAILRRGPLPLGYALRVAEQVLSALEYAHGKGVIHRDIKPANILIDRTGKAKLADFGLAKQQNDPSQTNQGIAVGTVFYMPPEQIRGMTHIDWRADIYAVGVVLYEMLTARRPFDGPEHFSVMRAHVELDPVPASQLAPNVPEAVDPVIVRALQKDPRGRYQSAGEFRAALQDLYALEIAAKVAAQETGGTRWQYATYLFGLAALFLAAFALPPWLPGGPVETLEIQMPPAPSAPPVEFFVRTNEPEPPAPVLAPPVAPLGRAEEVVAPKPPARFTATRIENLNAEEPVPLRPPAAPAVPRIVTEPPAPIANPPALAAPNEPVRPIVPEAAPPMVQAPLPTEKPGWVRRTVTKFPRIFRKNEKPENKP